MQTGCAQVTPLLGQLLIVWSILFCNPPLCINEEQLAEAYGIIDECLAITDEVFEG